MAKNWKLLNPERKYDSKYAVMCWWVTYIQNVEFKSNVTCSFQFLHMFLPILSNRQDASIRWLLHRRLSAAENKNYINSLHPPTQNRHGKGTVNSTHSTHTSMADWHVCNCLRAVFGISRTYLMKVFFGFLSGVQLLEGRHQGAIVLM